MKTILVWLCCITTACASAQTLVNRSFPVKAGQTIALQFDYPKVVRVSTWDKNEVAVKATVSINDGQNDSAFELEATNEDGKLTIKNLIRDMDKLPHIYKVMKDGVSTTFHSREAFDEFRSKAGQIRYSSDGVDVQVNIEIKVPANTQTNIKATYGIVELVDFNGPAIVNATYGGIDATLSEAKTGKLTATTSYGQIYSNLELKLTDKTEKDFFTSITAEPGKGPAYDLKSTYGKIYLRKP